MSMLINNNDYYNKVSTLKDLFYINNSVCISYLNNISEFLISNNFELNGNLFKNIGDVKKGVYEGGFKLWECEKDLSKYLYDIKDSIVKKDILELGCGSGLAGILCSLLNCNSVYLQDYNKEVLQYYTIPNIKLNNCNNCILLNGAWDNFDNILRNNCFDINNNTIKSDINKFQIILGSDILYENINYEALLNIFKKYLSLEGIIIIATKAYYFGNNGSFNEFEYFVQNDNSFKLEILSKIEDKVSNIRYIFSLKFK